MEGRTTTPYIAGPGGSSPTRAAPAGGRAPVASCIMTGYGSAEPSLAIVMDGTIFLAPIFTPQGNGLLRSRDNGATWEVLIPRFEGERYHNRAQPFLYLDQTTERLFFHTTLLNFMPPSLRRGFNMTWSDDQGDTWNHLKVAEDAYDWLKVYGGPPVSSHTDGYPNILYMSAPTPISTRFWPLFYPRKQQVYRSLDGGRTWSKAGALSLDPTDIPGCSHREWVIYGAGVVAKDGTVFIAGRRGPHLGLGISKDEGMTWTVRDVPGSKLLKYWNIMQVGVVNGNYVIPEPLALDAEGNLYAVWPDEKDLLRMAYSTDMGETWSEPVVVSAPGVKHIRYGMLATGAHGKVAIAYYGSRNNIRYDGYIAESNNAMDPEPVFWSATVNDPSDPLYRYGFNVGYLGMYRGGDLNEIVHVRYAPDGDVWASFCKRMPPFSPGWDRASHARSKLQAVVGRLIH
jgi:hypothetical protein